MVESVKPWLYTKFYGLYDLKDKRALPLKSIDIEVTIDDSIARVHYNQTYVNDSKNKLETEYFFPISSSACFDSFEARYDNQVIKGIIKEKEEAKKEYEENKAKGNTVAYSEIVDDPNKNIMKVNLGNIPPSSTIVITFAYLQHLKVAANKFWKFAFHSTMNPNKEQSSESIENQQTLASYPLIKSNDDIVFPWTIKVTINSKNKITYLKSPTHEIDIEYVGAEQFLNQAKAEQNSFKAIVNLNKSKNYVPNKDFHLLYSNDSIHEPTILTTSYDEGYCSMIKFVPNFEKTTIDEAYKIAQETKEITYKGQSSGEYIFLLDKSGSMTGTRIQKAKEALISCIQSLPANSYFNVFNYGTGYDKLFSESKPNNQSVITEAIGIIKDYDADMGGNAEYQVLKAIYGMKRLKKYPRAIIFITDGGFTGESGSLEQCLELIEENSLRCRLFTIGIGMGSIGTNDEEFIKKSAEKGKGKCDFVSDSQTDDLSSRFKYMLEEAITPCLDNFTMEFDDSEAIDYIIPNPNEMNYILRNESVNFFVFFKNNLKNKEAINVKITCYDTSQNKQLEFNVKIENFSTQKNQVISKLGIHKLIYIIEDKEKNFDKTDIVDIVNQRNTDFSKELVKLSTKYQILCKKTAFIAKADNSNDIIQQIPEQKVVIPNIEPDIPENIPCEESYNCRDAMDYKPLKVKDFGLTRCDLLMEMNKEQARKMKAQMFKYHSEIYRIDYFDAELQNDFDQPECIQKNNEQIELIEQSNDLKVNKNLEEIMEVPSISEKTKQIDDNNDSLSENVTFCPTGHFLQYDEKNERNYSCNICGVSRTKPEESSRYCKACNYDLCPKCAQAKLIQFQILLKKFNCVKCSEGMKLETGNEVFFCERCGKSPIQTPNMIFECKNCKINACVSCFQNFVHQEMLNVIKKQQKEDGRWELNTTTMQLLGLDKVILLQTEMNATALQTLPVGVDISTVDIRVTKIILKLLELELSKLKELWQENHQLGLKWIESQGKNIQNYES